jgi:membrane protein YdbS with pleckstrin-like domain
VPGEPRIDQLGYVSAPLPLHRVLSLSDEPSLGVARYLFATEEFRGEWRLHWIKLVKRTIYAAIALVLAWMQPGIARLHLDVDPADLRRGVTVVLGGAAAALLWSNVAWYFERFVITDRRIMLVTGLIVRRVTMMPLVRVTDMKYEQTVLGRMLGYGTFRVESAGRLNRMSRIRHMPDPNELYLRIVEEMYEPGAVQARTGATPAEDDENPP